MNTPTSNIHLNLRVRGLEPSATIAINELCDELRRQGRDVFKLGLGQSPFPVPRSVGEELRKYAFEKDYLPVKGLLRLRETVARHHRREFNIECSPENILIGPGSKELMFLLQLVYYGDILIPSPAWVSYAPQARIIGRNATFLSTRPENGWRLMPEELDKACRDDPTRPRILILNYPSNPTGGTYSGQELAALADVARKFGVLVLSDEIYGKLHHEGAHESIVPIYPEGTIFSGGLSKWCGAGGWRLGLFVVPDNLRWLLDAMAAVASETFTSVCAPIQHAAVRAFEDSEDLRLYVRSSQRIVKALGAHCANQLRRVGAEVLNPQGGFYLFPSFSALREDLAKRGITTSSIFCHRLLEETGVAILPGSNFGRPASELTARLAYVNFDGAKAIAALDAAPQEYVLDEAYLNEFCGPTVEAINRFCDWIELLKC